ncbi:MAG: GNAT family N-acetyltransferase [Rhizomicrobium sp.]|jgi:predicted acetyltransferase
MMLPCLLIKPALEYLPSYKSALERGWGPDNLREAEAAREHLARIATDAELFVALHDDPQALAGPVTLPDGSQVARLPGITRWLWDGEFCGSINLRWQNGTSALPSHVLGHIGFSVVPWKRRLGHATRTLALLLPEARAQGLEYVELTTAPDNIASQKVILANGGQVIERFRKAAAYGGDEGLRFRIVF